MAQLQKGDRINNYLLDECIGTGHFGEVWKARHHVFNEIVAIKIPTDPRYVRQLQHEGMAIHTLESPNIVRGIDLDPYANPPYLIMEYVNGPSLRQLIEENRQGLPIDTAVTILVGTLRALEAAHRANVIHRDIKPSNILIENGTDLPNITSEQVKVADFGVGYVTTITAETIMQSGSMDNEEAPDLAGTVVYMSPEQRDGKALDGRSDLYAVGVVAHEMLTGLLPQGTDMPGTIRSGIPKWMDELFARCYTRLEHRFNSATELLTFIQQHEHATSPPPPPPVPPAARVRREGTSLRCSQCGKAVTADDNFCIYCGNQIVEQLRRCPSCHAYAGSRDNFCIFCGADLRLQ